MKNINKKFLENLGDSWRLATPGLCIQAHYEGRKILDVAVGETFEYYDLASLTKIVFTVSALMFRHDEKAFKLHDPISKFIEWYPEASSGRIRDLLSHSAGLTWLYPFYKTVVKKTTPRTTPEEAWQIFSSLLKRKVLSDFKKQSQLRQSHFPFKSVYSDLDFFLLGIALEEMTHQPLFDVWQGVRERMALRNTDFHRGNVPKLNRSFYAPTENDVTWRGKLLQGEVHDQNTWSLRGVAPHAGLFGTMDDLSLWGLRLRRSLRGAKSVKFASPETVKRFTKRALPRARGDWALGFMLPSKDGPSCGKHFSLNSVGHMGFTGTSLWYDPKQDLLVTILSNRIHPSVDNIAIRTLRPQIHTWIAGELSNS